MRRRLVAVALCLAALAGLFAAGLFPQGPLKRAAERRLSRALEAQVAIERLHLVPWRLTLAAEGISVESPALRMRVAQLRLEMLPSLLRGSELSLRRLEVQGFDIEARPRPAAAPGAAPGGDLPPVRIHELALSGGQLRYSDPALEGDVLVSGIAADGAIGHGSLDVRLAGVRFQRQPAPPPASLQARLEIGPDLRASLARLEISTPRSKLRADGPLGSLLSPAPDLRVEAELDASELGGVAGLAPARGVVRAKGQLKAGTALQWQADVTAAALEVRGLALAALRAQASGRGSDASARLAVGGLGGHVSIEGRLANGKLEARADATGIQADAAARLAALPLDARGALAGSVTLRGPLSRLSASATLAGPELSLDGTPLSIRAEAAGSLAPESGDVQLAWSVHGEALPNQSLGPVRVVGARIEASGTVAGAGTPTIEARGRGQLDVAGSPAHAVPFEVAYRGRGDQVAAFSVDVAETALAGLAPGAAGFGALHLQAQGPASRLGGSARLEARDVSWREVRVGAIRLDAAGRSGDWSLSGTAPDNGLGLEATSPHPERGPRRLSGALTLASSALAPLAPLLPASLPRDGRVSGRLAFEGPLGEPTAFQLRSELTLEGSGYQARVAGTAGATETSPLDLQLTGRADVAALERVEDVDLAGELNADLRLRGSFAQPSAIGSVRLANGRLSGKGLPELRVAEAEIVLDGPSAELRPTRLSLADGEVTASGRAPLSGDAPAELHVEWTGLAAQQLLAALAKDGATPASLQARLSGRAHLAGQGRDLLGWRADATLRAEDVRAADLEISLTPLSLRLERGVLEAAPVTLTSGPGSLSAHASLDLRRRTLALEGKGALDLRALSPLVGNASLSGLVELDLAVGGSFDAPSPRGAVVIRDTTLRARDIPEALTGVAARIVFEGESVRLEEAKASLGGGSVTASGTGTLRGTTLTDLRVDIRGRDMALRYPIGLRSRLEADLTLSQANGGYLLRGDVRALRGLYDLDLAIEQSVKAPVVEAQPSALLRSIGLDIRVVLESPVLIRNKLASLDVEGNLQFRGDLETPGPFGRLEINPGGKIFLGGRHFPVETGRLAYAGDWDPEVTLRARQTISGKSDLDLLENYDVRLEASGKLSTVQPTLKADGLTDTQVLSLVATGRTTGGAGKALGARVAGEQAASLVLGQLSQGLGLDEVAVQPELLARDTDPGTRFTFGKQLTPMLSLIYSLSLSGPEQRFAQVEARLPYQVSLKGQRTDDGVLAAGAGQRIRFGGQKRPRAAEDRVRLTSVRFEGELPEAAKSSVEARPGKRVASWDVQEDADRLRLRLVELGYVEAQVGGRIEGEAALFQVRIGPRFAWRVTGMESPPDLGPAFRQALYEEDAVERARAQLIQTLRERGQLRGRVSAVHAVSEGSERTLEFEVEPGPVFSSRVEFPGAQIFSPRALLRVAGGPGALATEPDEAVHRIVAAYAAAARFAVKVGPVVVEEAGTALQFRVPIDEGPEPRVAAVSFVGATLVEDSLREVAALAIGSAYSLEAVGAATERLRSHYYSQGYAQPGVVAENTLRGPDVEVRFQVREGERLVIGTIEIVGLRRTRESLVRRQIALEPGDPVDPRRLARTERRLLDLGTFSQVFVSASAENPTTLRIELVEKEWAIAAYELRWSQETGSAVQVDSEVRNLLGLGLNLGGRYHLGGEDREKRASLLVPSFRRGKFTVAAFEIEEDFEATDIFTGELVTNTQTERVLEFQQTLPVTRQTNVLAGYRFKSLFSTQFPDPIHIATVFLSGFRETRDNPLDARRGHLGSLTLEVSPEPLASDLTFIKGYGQLFLHRPLGGSFTWSQGLRLGLAHGFGGQVVVSSERFTAGGADTMRGFAQESLGPKDFLGEPTGGDAVLIFNEELRYRHASGLGFALFWDFGNVFATVNDLSLDLRHDLGVGLRWVSPIGLLRLDLAFPLDRRTDEDAYQLVFSLGQAF